MDHVLIVVLQHITDSLINNVNHVILHVKLVHPIHHVLLVKMVFSLNQVYALPIVEVVSIHSEEFVLLVINHVNHVMLLQLNVLHVIRVSLNSTLYVLIHVLMELILIIHQILVKLAQVNVQHARLKIPVQHVLIA